MFEDLNLPKTAIATFEQSQMLHLFVPNSLEPVNGVARNSLVLGCGVSATEVSRRIAYEVPDLVRIRANSEIRSMSGTVKH